MMIKVQNSFSKPLLAVGVVVVALLGAGAWWWSSGVDQPSALDGGAAGSGEAQGLWPSAGVGDDASANPSATAPSLADARPDGVDADDWQRLLAVMGRMGQSKEDARRLVGLVRFQRDFEKMQTLDQEQDARARRRMAEALMAELPERLKTGEFTLMESAFMGAALIAEIEADDARRVAQLAKWQAEMAMLVPQAENEVAVAQMSRETEWKRRQAQAFMDWQTQADASQRTEAKLEQVMEAARREFNSNAR